MTTRSFTPEIEIKDPVGKLSWMLSSNSIKVEYGIATGCKCLCCYCFRITWEDDNEKLHVFEHDYSLEKVIDKAWEKIYDNNYIKAK